MKSLINCSFCGLNQDEVKNLITGPDVYICEECVALCVLCLKDKNIEIDEIIEKLRKELNE